MLDALKSKLKKDYPLKMLGKGERCQTRIPYYDGWERYERNGDTDKTQDYLYVEAKSRLAEEGEVGSVGVDMDPDTKDIIISYKKLYLIRN